MNVYNPYRMIRSIRQKINRPRLLVICAAVCSFLLVACSMGSAAPAIKAARNPSLPRPQVTVIHGGQSGNTAAPQQATPTEGVVARPIIVTVTPSAGGQTGVLPMPTLALAPALPASPTATPEPKATLAGWPAPAFDLRVINMPGRETISLESLKGKPTMLGYFTTWCTTCRDEFPVVNKVYEQMKDKVQFVYINGAESEDLVNTYIQQMGIQLPVALDRTASVSHEYRVQVLPTSFFIDSNGRIVNYYMGAMTEEALLDRLSKIVDQ